MFSASSSFEGKCPLLALSGHCCAAPKCPLSGVKRTLALQYTMSAFDPKRTFEGDVFLLLGEREQA